MSRVLQDLRYALRQLRKGPGFTVVVVLTVTLGIGVSTAMFGVLNAVLLRPLPFPDADLLVRVFSTRGDTVRGPSPLDVRDFAAQNHTFALINQAFADRYFPNQDPVGKQIRMGLDPILAASASGTPFTIVGVIGNFMNRGVALPPLPHITTLARQTPLLNVGFKNLIVRTVLDPLQLSPPIRRELHALDANLPFAEVSTVEQIMEQQTADRRYTTGLLGLFAVFGVMLAGIGVYGVVSYVVAQRTGEIGVRMALGAGRQDVVWIVMKQGLTMAAIGAIAGLFGAWILRRVVAQLVFGISPADPATSLVAAMLLIVFAAIAAYIPARRAAKVDPMVALRYA
jgi:putative ABC transport system permease protein